MKNKHLIILFQYIILAILLSSCAIYEQEAVNRNTLSNKNHLFVIHQADQRYFLYDALVCDSIISGIFTSTVDYSHQAQAYHLYMFSDFDLPVKDQVPIEIPFSAINSVEWNKINKGETAKISFGASGAFILLSAAVVGITVLFNQ